MLLSHSCICIYTWSLWWVKCHHFCCCNLISMSCVCVMLNTVLSSLDSCVTNSFYIQHNSPGFFLVQDSWHLSVHRTRCPSWRGRDAAIHFRIPTELGSWIVSEKTRMSGNVGDKVWIFLMVGRNGTLSMLCEEYYYVLVIGLVKWIQMNKKKQ